MVGGSRHDRLERLIDEVRRGGRDLASIRDDSLRDAVRIALQMHATAPGGLDPATRARMKNRVLRASQPRPISLRDRLFLAFDMLARPAPYIVRGVAAVVIVAALAGGATVASADTLPDDPLYAVKLAGEELRLALASTSEDRASVELSIADHRLSEAERLAATGRVDDAIMASSSYSERVARAAAQLSVLETAEQTTSSTTSSLLAQLDTRFTTQRARALTLSVRLNTDPATAGGGQVLAAVAAPTLAPGRTQAERVAETAAVVAESLARVATTRADETLVKAPPVTHVDAATQTDAPRAAGVAPARVETPSGETTPRAAQAQAAVEQSQASDASRNTTAAGTSTQKADGPVAAAPNRDTATQHASDTKPDSKAGAAARANDRPSEQASKVVEATRKSADEARKAADEAKSPKHEKDNSKDKGAKSDKGDNNKNEKGGSRK